MIEVKLARACRRRERGAPMVVTDRAAYEMMKSGDAQMDRKFMADFEIAHGIRPEKKKPERGPGRPRKDMK